jgi:Cu/Ag efflux pump CusA
MLGDLMSSVSPIEVKVFGNNQKELQKIAKQVAQIVEKTEGVI